MVIGIKHAEKNSVSLSREFVEKLLSTVDLVLINPEVLSSAIAKHAKCVGRTAYQKALAQALIEIDDDGEFYTSSELLEQAKKTWCLRYGTPEEAVLCALASAAISDYLASENSQLAIVQSPETSLYLVEGVAEIRVQRLPVVIDVYSFARAILSSDIAHEPLKKVARLINVMKGGDWSEPF